MSRLRMTAACLAIAMAGSAAAETAKPRNVLEWLFGGRKEQAPTAITPPAPQQMPVATPPSRPGDAKAAKPARREASAPAPSIRKARKQGEPARPAAMASGPYSGPFRGGGNNAFCVRTCDGFFFPINHEGAQGGDRYESACQSSCPGAETQVFFMKRGGDIKWSSNARGVGYMSLENALKYRKERDPACSCKDQQQQWASVLAPVEAMMKQAKNDIVVTDQNSESIAAGALAAPATETVARGEDKAKTATRADVASDQRSSTIRSSFGEKITPATRFTRIDPQPTGAVTPRPAVQPKASVPVAAQKIALPPARPDRETIDRTSLRKALERLAAADQRQ